MSRQFGAGRAGKTGRKVFRVIRYGLYLFLSVFILLEVALRIYNPFHLRLKGDRIVLPINQRATITNRINPKLDPVIVNTRNSLGFRGPEPPDAAAWNKRLTLITVGGSTTECHFLSDSLTWPFLLGRQLTDSFPDCWLNNAGLDGHTTFGHLVLLNDHIKKLQPAVVLFLTGMNDVETPAPSFHDKLNTRGAYTDLKHWLFENSEVLNLALNMVRGWRAQHFNNTTNDMLVLNKIEERAIPDAAAGRRLDAQKPFLDAYRARLESLADTCTGNHILPVFLTQPNLFGYGIDSLSGANLERYPIAGDDSLNGGLIWKMLEEYNDVTRSVCREKKLPLIDLAHLMPKNSLYYYDMSHFTNAGASEVARLVDRALVPILKIKFPPVRN
jgi:lysophospholipase L1-like esterase